MNVDVSHDGALTGSENMRRDLLLVEQVREGSVDIAFRTYQWTPWCVSLGTHQSASAIDLDMCVERGYDVVHRPTGGRAVLHANELTYALALRIPSGCKPLDVYKDFHAMLHSSLVSLAPELALSTAAPSLRDHYASSGPLGQVCFSAHAPSELLWHGRKVVGSAQRVVDGIVLQHGSIVCGPEHLMLGELLAADNEVRERTVATMRRTSATLTDVAGHTITPSEVASALRASLTQERLSGLIPQA